MLYKLKMHTKLCWRLCKTSLSVSITVRKLYSSKHRFIELQFRELSTTFASLDLPPGPSIKLDLQLILVAKRNSIEIQYEICCITILVLKLGVIV